MKFLKIVKYKKYRVNVYLTRKSCRFQVPLILSATIVFLFVSANTIFAGFIQLDGIADVKTRFSRGCSSLQEVAEEARAKGIDTVIFGDQARDAVEYGIVPLERIIRNRNENPAILTMGAPAYIAEINDNDKQFEETLLIAGAEVAPFYYWTGNIFRGNLVANNSDKHLLVVGLDTPNAYEQLPILDSNFSKRYLAYSQEYFGGCILFFLLFIIAYLKGYKKKFTRFVAGIMFLLVLNNMPFRSSPFSQYKGDLGIQPYQELIDYVNSNGGLIFWNHMEAPNEIKQKGRVSYKTDPYPKDLLLTSNYGGFQSVANFPVMQIEPGREWDNVLGEYIQGKRKKPVWGYGANNYLCEDGGTELGEIRTIFLVRQKSRTDVLDAMASGRMYAVRQTGDERISLDDFTISDALSGRQASMGEELVSNDFPELKIKVRMTNGTEKSVRLSVIRNGLEVKQETIALPYELTWRDVNFDKNDGPVFYRLKVEADPKNYLVSNPIFIRFDEIVGAQDDSVAQITTKKLNMAEPIKPKVALPQNPSTPEIEPSNEAIQNKVLPEPRPLESKNIEVASVISPTILKQPIPPVAKMPTPPIFTDPFATITRSVIAKIDGVSLKNGPGPKFPEVGKLNKGDRLALIRSTKINFNGKPWLLVDLGGRKAYVWSDLVATK
ncbi:MAG: SH3 domain-containing protein [Nitrospina sp.]|nr:SH3 domain-containing protein [Nitrospina sp.]MBT6601389.1 SH3 domain-containing protein [Nitrospina sp.]